MDPLSLSASIIAVLQMTSTVLSYLNDVNTANRDQTRLAVEASNLYALLTSLRFRVEQANGTDPWFTAIRTLGTNNGPLEQMKDALDRLAKKIEPVRGIEKLGRQITWTFKKAELDEILSKIERVKSLVNIALTNDLFTLSQTISNELNNVGKDVAAIGSGVAALHIGKQDEERQKILTWLSPLDFRSRQQEIFKGRQEGTRQWLFASDKFKLWVEGKHKVLWCPGIPGAGKTITSSIIIDYLQSRFKGSNITVVCLFCNYRDRQSQTADTFMASFIKQIVEDIPTLSGEVKSLYQQRKGPPEFKGLSKVAQTEVCRFSKVFLIMDALDETTENVEIRDHLLSKFESLPINLLVTSRYHTSIERRFKNAQRLEILATAEDIRTYIGARILSEPSLARHVQSEPALQDVIAEKITEKSKGM